jgi:NAD(P)-dependent dehydrogenase (short-subunit alcohol dehydrogenase family)
VTSVQEPSQRVVLVTGAARGQGRANALAFARQGADVVLLDACAPVARTSYPPATEADLVETAEQCQELGRRAWTSVVDLRDGAAVRSCVDAHIAVAGRLDVIVVNAGVAFFRPFLELTDDDWDTMLANNLTTAQRTLTAAVPHMVRAGNGGSIVVTTSVAGLKVIPFEAHYVAAKHGLVGLMRALAVELAEFDIRVNAVAPGGVATAMAEGTEVHERIFGDERRAARFTASFNPLLTPNMASAEEVADIVTFLCSAAARAVTGHVLPIDFGVTAR